MNARHQPGDVDPTRLTDDPQAACAAVLLPDPVAARQRFVTVKRASNRGEYLVAVSGS